MDGRTDLYWSALLLRACAYTGLHAADSMGTMGMIDPTAKTSLGDAIIFVPSGVSRQK